MDINQAIREIVREELAEHAVAAEPELITVAQFVEAFGVDKSVVLRLVEDRAANGFPAVVLGPRTIKIDKHRLNAWFARGGLGVRA